MSPGFVRLIRSSTASWCDLSVKSHFVPGSFSVKRSMLHPPLRPHLRVIVTTRGGENTLLMSLSSTHSGSNIRISWQVFGTISDSSFSQSIGSSSGLCESACLFEPWFGGVADVTCIELSSLRFGAELEALVTAVESAFLFDALDATCDDDALADGTTCDDETLVDDETFGGTLETVGAWEVDADDPGAIDSGPDEAVGISMEPCAGRLVVIASCGDCDVFILSEPSEAS